MAIHTFQLVTPPINIQKGRKRVFTLVQKSKCRIVSNKKGTLTFIINDMQGITMTFVSAEIPYLTMRVNPSVMLGGGYADLCNITLENFELLAASISKALAMLEINMTFSQLKLSRVDCTIDIDFPYKKGEMDFLRCLQHGGTSESYKIQRFDKTWENYEEKNRHSFRATCKDAHLTVYDKSYQLLEEGLMGPEDVPTDRLRFEVALENPAFQRVVFRYRQCTLYELNERIIWFSDMSMQILRDYFERVLTPGQYVQLQEALQIINQSGFPAKIKDRMKDFLYKVARCHRDGVSGAVQAFLKQGLTRRQIQTILEHFKALDLNPATIYGSSEFTRFPSVAEILSSQNVLPASIS